MELIRRRILFRAGFALLAMVAVLFALTPSFRAADPIPSQIADDAYWKMISEFSEPGGYFRFENFLSNELGFQYVIPALKKNTKPGGAYFGVGPEQNFTYLVALQPKIAFIIDIRRQNMLEHLMYKAAFQLAPDRADFLSLLFSRKRPDDLKSDSTPEALFSAYSMVHPDPDLMKKNIQAMKDVLVREHRFGLSKEDLDDIGYVYNVFFEAGPALDYSYGGGGIGGGMPNYSDLMAATDESGQNRGFLASEENYRTIREMERKNLIVPLVGDFAGPKAIRAAGQYVRDHDATVSAFYLSNVEQYLFQDGVWKQFYTNVSTLPLDSSSTFIRSFNGGGGFSGGPRPFGFRFKSVLSSIPDILTAFKEGRIRSYGDVTAMSQ